MTNSSIYWIGNDHSSQLKVVRLYKPFRVVLISGLSGQLVWLLYGCFVLIATVLLVVGQIAFAIVFLALSLLFWSSGFLTRGERFWFEQQWIAVTEKELTFRQQKKWSISEVKQVSWSYHWISNIEDSEVPGWIIEFQNISGELLQFQIQSRQNFQLFWRTLHELKNLPLVQKELKHEESKPH